MVRGSSDRPVVALLPWGEVIEDFLDSIGITVDEFLERYDGTWMFGFVDALARGGATTVIVWPSRAVRKPERRVHGPSGATVWLLPPTRTWRMLRRSVDEPYAYRARDAAPTRSVPQRA